MNQAFPQKVAAEEPAIGRVNFSDDNRALHEQAFFAWLPEELHDATHIDWTRLPSRVIAYLVNSVGDSSFASALALVAGAAVGTMGEYTLLNRITQLHLLLRPVQTVF